MAFFETARNMGDLAWYENLVVNIKAGDLLDHFLKQIIDNFARKVESYRVTLEMRYKEMATQILQKSSLF